MRHSRALLVLLATFLAVSASAGDARSGLTVNLKFVPQEGVQSNSPNLSPSALERTLAIRVEDSRGGDKRVSIGEGTNDDDETFPIRASTDVIAFVSDTLPPVANAWGLRLTEKPDRVLALRLAQFTVDESNKAVGSMYAAQVKFAYVLTDSSGAKLVDGTAAGSAQRYGRARSADNCNEVLSDALKEAFANVLSDARLQEAWASGRPARDTSDASRAESVEERLTKLDDLLKKGLITKEEYDRKRAEILKDL